MSDNNLNITIGSKLASGFGSAFTNARNSVGGLRDEIIGLRKQQSLIKKFEMNMDAAKKARTRLSDVKQEIKLLDYQISKDRKVGLSTKTAEKNIQTLANRAKRLETTLGNTNQRLLKSKQVLSDAGISAKNSATAYTQLDSKIKKLNTSYSDLRQTASKKLAISQGFSELKSKAVGLAVTIGTVGYAIKQMTDSSNQLQGLNSAYTAIFGTVQAGAAQMEFVRQSADNLGLNFVSLAGSYKNWAAAAEESSMKGKVQQEVFLSVASASKVLGLSTENTKGTLNAMSQMISKGVVSSEELKQQMGEHLPGAFGLAAKAMGVSTAELGDMLKKGEVLATDLLPRLAAELNKKYGDGLSDASKRLEADTERLNNQISAVSSTFGNILTPAAQNVTKAFTGVLSSVNAFATAHPQVVTGAMAIAAGFVAISTAALAIKTGGLLVGLISLTPAVTALGAALPAVSAGITAMSVAMMANPIIAIAAAITAALGAWVLTNYDVGHSVQWMSGRLLALVFSSDAANKASKVSEFSYQSLGTAITATAGDVAKYIAASGAERVEIRKGIAARIIEVQSYLEVQRAALMAAMAKSQADRANKGFSLFSNENIEAEKYAAAVSKISTNITKGIGSLNSLKGSLKGLDSKPAKTLATSFGKLPPVLSSSTVKTKKLTTAQKQAQKAQQALAKSLELAKGSMGKTKSEVRALELSLKSGYTPAMAKAQAASEAKIKTLTDLRKAESEATKAVFESVNALKVAESSIGNTDQQVREMALSLTSGYTPAMAQAQAATEAKTKVLTDLRAAQESAKKAVEQSASALSLATSALGKTDQATRALELATKSGYTPAMAQAQAATEAQTKKLQNMRADQASATAEINKAKNALETNRIKLVNGADAARVFELRTKGYSAAQAASMLNIEKTNAALDKHGDVISSIEGALTDAALDGFKSFKDLGQKIKDIFNDMVLRPVIQAVMAPISGAIAGIMPSAAQAGTGAAGSAGMLSGIQNMIFGNSIGTGVSSLGSSLGTSLFSNAGSFSNLAYGGVGLVSNLLGNALFGEGGGTGSSLGSLGAMAAGFGPVGVILGGLLGGALGGLGGKNDPSTTLDQSIISAQGEQSDNGASHIIRESAFGKFGLVQGTLRYEARSEEYKAAMQNVLDVAATSDNLIAGLMSTSEIKVAKQKLAAQDTSWGNNAADMEAFLANRLNVQLSVMDDGLRNLIQTSGDYEAQLQRVAEVTEVSSAAMPLLNQLGFDLGGSIVTATKWGDALKINGESAANALVRAATSFNVINQSAALLSLNFTGTGLGILKASDSLITLMGGLDQFSAATSTFYQNFYSEAERNNIALATSAETIRRFNDDLGNTAATSISSKDGLRRYIESLDLTSAAGQKAFVAAMDVQDSFITLSNSGQTLQEAFDTLPASALATAQAVLDASSTQATATDNLTSSTNELTTASNSTSTALKTVSEAFGGLITKSAALVSALAKIKIPSSTGTDGSHATGLFSVPKDNYKANLHANEMVLPARLARVLQSGGSLTGGNKLADIKQSKASKRAAAVLAASATFAPMAAAAGQQPQLAQAPVINQEINISISAEHGMNEQDIADQVVMAIAKAKADAERQQRGRLNGGGAL